MGNPNLWSLGLCVMCGVINRFLKIIEDVFFGFLIQSVSRNIRLIFFQIQIRLIFTITVPSIANRKITFLIKFAYFFMEKPKLQIKIGDSIYDLPPLHTLSNHNCIIYEEPNNNMRVLHNTKARLLTQRMKCIYSDLTISDNRQQITDHTYISPN